MVDVEPSDRVRDNARWKGAAPRISVLAPTYQHDCSRLIDALAASPQAARIEIVVLDDGSRDPRLTAALDAAADRAACPVRIVHASRNRGRAGARNALTRHARAPWVVLLDADMMPDDAGFIGAYLRTIDANPEPALIVGGYSLKLASDDPRFALHRWQAERSECLSAAQRSLAPGRHVFTSNVMAHRSILRAYPFDQAFAGWGWEDTDWGLRIAAAHPVIHIDNTATHMGLDEDAALIAKYRSSAANFAMVAARHPAQLNATALHRAAILAKKLPFRRPLAALAERATRATVLPVAIRGHALKAMRALAYSEVL